MSFRIITTYYNWRRKSNDQKVSSVFSVLTKKQCLPATHYNIFAAILSLMRTAPYMVAVISGGILKTRIVTRHNCKLLAFYQNWCLLFLKHIPISPYEPLYLKFWNVMRTQIIYVVRHWLIVIAYTLLNRKSLIKLTFKRDQSLACSKNHFGLFWKSTQDYHWASLVIPLITRALLVELLNSTYHYGITSQESIIQKPL